MEWYKRKIWSIIYNKSDRPLINKSKNRFDIKHWLKWLDIYDSKLDVKCIF